MINKNKIATVLISLTVLFALSCKDDVETTPSKSSVAFKLTDAPCDYDHLYIDVQGIEVHTDANGWELLSPFNQGIYDVLELTNGLDTLLCQVDLPAGIVSQVRLILGENNSLVVDGVTHDMKVPSGQESGLKLNIHKELEGNKSYTIWLDFDACKSVVNQGNGSYSLKPVIRAFTELTNGKLTGVVLPDTVDKAVHVIQNLDTITAIPNSDGRFMVCGLDGTYDVWIESLNTNYSDSSILNVPVGFGQIVSLDTIYLHQ